MTHLRVKKEIRLSAFKSSTTNRLFWIGQMAIQNFLRQSQRPIQELADQRKFFLEGVVRRSDGSTIFLLERSMCRQVPSRNENLASPTT